MKSFLKLIVSIIVVLVVGFTTYFLLKETENYNSINDNDISINDISENINENNSHIEDEDQKDNNDIENTLDNNFDIESEFNESDFVFISGDKASGEISNVSGNYSGEQLNEEVISQVVSSANMLRTQNNNETLIDTIEDSVGVNIIGTEYQDLLNILETNELSVNVQTAGTMVYILPVSDFVNNQQYHYDENGDLVLYVCELMGIGGEIRYYFNENQLVKTEEKIDGELFTKYEDENEIVQRAKLVYDKYFKQ